MSPVIEAHFYAPDDLNGSTIFECSSDDNFVKNIHLDIQRDKLGAGTIEFARRVPAGGLFTREIVVPEVFVRYLIPSIDATHYIWGNFIGPRQQQVISKAESGGEGFKFGGPGPKFYLTRMILWSASFSGQDNAVDRAAGLWTWPESASAGRIMARLLQEEQDNPHGPFLPDLTASFGDVNDSDGVPWTDDVSGTDDFSLNIQDDYLKILWQLENAGELISNMNLGTVSNPLMQLGMYQSFGRDLTGAIAADTVHFTEGINISNDLDVEGESLKKGTHALVRGADGIYHFVASPDFVSGEYKKMLPVDYTSSANTSTLDRAGKRALRRQRIQEHGIELRIVPGFDPANGLYMPGFDGTDGHFWLSDTVDLTTGISPNQTELDYDDESQLVTGIELELAKAVKDGSDLEAARSFDVTVHLNEDRTSDSTTPSRKGGGSPAGSANCSCLKLCRAAIEGECTRLYLDNTTPTTVSGVTPDAAWEETGSADGVGTLKTAPDGDYASTAAITTSLIGLAGGEDHLYGTWAFQMDAAMAAIIAAGGATIRAQFLARARYGIGISEAAQDMISQIGVRVTTGTSTTIRGTALALHALASSAGSSKWPAQATKVNRVFPAEAANNVLSAVPGAVAGDWLIVEVGSRNFTTVTSGGRIGLMSDGTDDLPEDVTETDTGLNSWIEICTGSTGDPLAGTSTRAARCDHGHEHPLLSVSESRFHNAADIEYDPTISGLDALNVQDAIDELSTSSGVTLSDDTPLVESGSGDEGTSGEASRSDHVHPAASAGSTSFVSIVKWSND